MHTTFEDCIVFLRYSVEGFGTDIFFPMRFSLRDALWTCCVLFQLALKHRQGKNHRMRIVAFVGSPVECNEKDVSETS